MQLAILAFTFTTAYLYVILLKNIWNNYKKYFFVFVGLSIVLGWLLYPVSCDTHESFIDQPNKTCTCVGVILNWYLKGVFDGASVDYCIGLKRIY